MIIYLCSTARYIKFPARLTAILSPTKFAMNRGEKQGVRLHQRFIVYRYDREIICPVTKEYLDRLEIVKGTGKVVNVNDNISVIESDMLDRNIADYIIPFENLMICDLVKPIQTYTVK